MLTLSFETSCDETSVAVLEDDKILSNIISSQESHSFYGGVIPELAAREHLKNLSFITDKAIAEAGIHLNNVDIIGATSEPGLIGALFIGLNFAKSVAFSLNSIFIPVNHLHAHIYSSFLNENKPDFPFLCLIISGGHTLLLLVKDYFDHEILGTTLDDAAGEAFDKVAKMLGLGYPGGPLIDKLSVNGDEDYIKFPKARIKDGKYNFSFSGIKTSVLYYLKKQGVDSENSDKLPDICASFQKTIIESLIDNVTIASSDKGVKNIVVTGGVSSNKALRKKFDNLKGYGYSIHYPRTEYTTDNAAMVGITAYYSYLYKYRKDFENKLFSVRARPKVKFDNF